MVLTPTNGYQSAVCRNKLRACFKGRTEGCPPAVNRGLACRNRRHSPSVYCLLMLTCTQPSSLAMPSACLCRSLRRSAITLRRPNARPPTVLLSYSVVKSFPTLPIRQSKAVTISLSVGCGSAILSESSRLRLHPTHLPSLRTSASPRIQRICAV